MLSLTFKNKSLFAILTAGNAVQVGDLQIQPKGNGLNLISITQRDQLTLKARAVPHHALEKHVAMAVRQALAL